MQRKERYYKSGKVALTETEVKELLACITKLEDEALLSLAISAGIRRSDIVNIHLSNIFDQNPSFHISFWEHKKKRNHIIWISGDAYKTLAQHMAKLPKKTKWLFPSHDPQNHISSRTAYNILQRWLNKAGIKSKPFHALRATCTKLCQKKGWTIEEVMELTGDTFRTIKVHYDTPSDDEMKEVARNKPLI